jgi:NodT family efflux transporter outer membrane factor (OMF) lipoprotein
LPLFDFIQLKNIKIISKLTMVGAVVFLQSCSSTTAITLNHEELGIPNEFQTSHIDTALPIESIDNFQDWLSRFNDPKLDQAISTALNYNRGLKAQRIALKIAEERLVVTKADIFPQVSLSANNSRRKTVSDDSQTYQNSASVTANLSYELDIWGKLSEKQKQAQLTYASAQANFNQQKVNLVTQVIKQWYNLIAANKLLELYKERSENLSKNLAMIQSSYNLGLGRALDVYLTQNNVTRELARVVQQQQTVKVETRTLETMLGEYPKGVFETSTELPKIDHVITANSPSEILTRRQDLQVGWLDLLALDAGLAVAHKQRFPRLSLSASTSDSDSDLSNLLSGNALAWSLIGNLTSPLFDAGRLASLEQQARFDLIKKEHQYLSQIYDAFAQVENVLSNHSALGKRFSYLQQAQGNALEAQKLSFNQYMRGLVSYTTVLESERRAFDAQTSLIQLTNQLLQNRANTFSALGGVINSDFSIESSQSTIKQDK